MAQASIEEEVMAFLKALAKHNDRDWFNKHKERYLQAHTNIIAFADALLNEMNKHDKIETPTGKKSLFRIYRDVRFSKDKTPYNTHWNGGFKRATKKLRGGYYFHIEPGNSYVAGGFWAPNPDDIKRIRQDIDLCHDEWRKVLSNKYIKNTFGKLRGEQVSSAPRGYSKEHPAIDLLRYKQFILKRTFTDKEVCGKDFVSKAGSTFKNMRPFFDYMSMVLTTDANGESVL